MMTTNADQLARYEIQALALLDRTALMAIVKATFDCSEADVDADGDIWIANPQTGRWLTGMELDKIAMNCGVRRHHSRSPYLERDPEV